MISTLPIDSPSKEELLAERHQSFIDFLVGELSDSVENIRSVSTVLSNNQPFNNLAEAIFARPLGDKIFDAIALEVQSRVLPTFSWEVPSNCDRYHKFQVWLVGLLGKLKIQKPRELFYTDEDCTNEQEQQEAYTERNIMGGAKRVDDSIPAKTLMVLVLKNFELTPTITACLDNIESRLRSASDADKACISCGNGGCEYNTGDSDDECDCEGNALDAVKSVEKSVMHLFTLLCVDKFFTRNSQFIERATKNLLPHPANTKDVSNLYFAFCEKPEKEQKDKERIAVIEKEQQESAELARIEELEAREKEITEELETTKKALSTLKKKHTDADEIIDSMITTQQQQQQNKKAKKNE